MEQLERTLKVYYHNSDTGQVPRIILQGRWLEELGYKVGDTITVNTSDQTITIHKKDGTE